MSARMVAREMRNTDFDIFGAVELRDVLLFT